MSIDGFPYRLVVLRHGQSEWNAAGVFTGWENAHLTAQGELEAARAGGVETRRRSAMNSRSGDGEHRIVVGVDGFESSKAALRWAIRQARLTGAGASKEPVPM